jgi:hypothetical protein
LSARIKIADQLPPNLFPLASAAWLIKPLQTSGELAVLNLTISIYQGLQDGFNGTDTLPQPFAYQ